MAAIKKPDWYKRDGPPIILFDPEGQHREAMFTEPLKVGQRATGIIGGIEVTVLLTEIVTYTRAHGRVIRIKNRDEDLVSFEDISLQDIVVITRDDIKCLDVDANTTV